MWRCRSILEQLRAMSKSSGVRIDRLQAPEVPANIVPLLHCIDRLSSPVLLPMHRLQCLVVLTSCWRT